MRKWFALVLCCVLLAPLGAQAAGLSGLGGGLSGLSELVSALPDPADALGVSGSLFQADYAFSPDLTCDAYLYAHKSADVDAYLSAAQAAGYTAAADKIDGYDGYYLTGGGYTAVLVPQFRNQLLLMVQKGMPFGENAAQPASADAEGEYVRLTYNGKTYDCTSNMYLNRREPLHNAYEIHLTPQRCKISSISFTIPDYAQDGDSFTAWKDHSVTGVEFYVAEDDSYGKFYVSDVGPIYSEGFAASTDYYVLKTESVELDGGVTVITGTIRARFLYDTLSYEIDFKVRVP